MKNSLPLLLLLTSIFLVSAPLHAELPSQSQQLLEKWKEFEATETAKLEATLEEKRTAVVELLRKQLADETRKGNLDGALAIQNEIAALTGKKEEMDTSGLAKTPAASWQLPEDAVRYKGDYYKVYPIADTLTWDDARTQCQVLGGDLGWLDNERDAEMLVKIMQPVIDAKGHAPIWIGGSKDSNGEWIWLSGKKVSDDFWSEESHKITSEADAVMIRWIASFRASAKQNSRVVGYLCRWKR